MTKLVKWLEKPVKVGGVPYSIDSLLIQLGLFLLFGAYLRIGFVGLLFYLGLIFSVVGYLIYWSLEIKSKPKQCSTNGC